MRPVSHARYVQRTGLFTIFAPVDETPNERVVFETTGYAGRGRGRNSPAHEAVRSVGPLPRGFYRVTTPRTDPRLGPLAFPLWPMRVTEMLGRSGFYIHGDSAKNPGNASHGCIVLSRQAREAVEAYRVRSLEVVPDHPAKAGD